MVIDDLEILISADAKGIDRVLKSTLQTVMGTVDKINSQEVDWTSIFTASVSPAIIAGVASTFAYAISNAVNFNAALATSGTAAGDSASQIAQVGQAALQASTQVPASAEDMASAMLKLSAIFTNVNDQQKIAQLMAELAASGFGDLNDIVNSSTQIFKDFGVTTTDEATSVLTDLMHSAEGAKESIPALVDQFSPFDAQLVASGLNVGDFNSILATFSSEIKNVGSANASQIFSALTTALSGTNPALNVLFGSVQNIKKSLVDDGGISAIQMVSSKLAEMGPSAALVATNLGLSAQQVAIFQENSSKFPKIASDAKDVANNTQSITDAFGQSNTAVNKLKEDWNTVRDELLIPAGNALAQGIVDWIDGLSTVLFKISQIPAAMQNAVSASVKSLNLLGSVFKSQFEIPPGMTDKISNTSTTADTTPTSLITALNDLTSTIKGNAGGISASPQATVNLSFTGNNSSQIAQQLYNMFQGTPH